MAMGFGVASSSIEMRDKSSPAIAGDGDDCATSLTFLLKGEKLEMLAKKPVAIPEMNERWLFCDGGKVGVPRSTGVFCSCSAKS